MFGDKTNTTEPQSDETFISEDWEKLAYYRNY